MVQSAVSGNPCNHCARNHLVCMPSKAQTEEQHVASQDDAVPRTRCRAEGFSQQLAVKVAMMQWHLQQIQHKGLW